MRKVPTSSCLSVPGLAAEDAEQLRRWLRACAPDPWWSQVLIMVAEVLELDAEAAIFCSVFEVFCCVFAVLLLCFFFCCFFLRCVLLLSDGLFMLLLLLVAAVLISAFIILLLCFCSVASCLVLPFIARCLFLCFLSMLGVLSCFGVWRPVAFCVSFVVICRVWCPTVF